MKLYIDTSSSEIIIIKLDGEEIRSEAKKEKAQKLLEILDESLNKRGKNLKDISEIEVNLGPGSFTGLRVGASVANALAWALQIPINGEKQIVEPTY
jgi:tRNA threonylcarbamoyladenosine biosynthesis protein TsaB